MDLCDGEEDKTDECKPTGRTRNSPGCLHSTQQGHCKMTVMLVWPACLPHPASKVDHKTQKGTEICILTGPGWTSPWPQKQLVGHLLLLRNVWDGAAGWDELLWLPIPCSLLSPGLFACHHPGTPASYNQCVSFTLPQWIACVARQAGEISCFNFTIEYMSSYVQVIPGGVLLLMSLEEHLPEESRHGCSLAR